MAFLGGLVFVLLSVIFPPPPAWPAWVVAGALIADAVLWGFVAALPVRSWWATLIVPVAFCAGVYVASLWAGQPGPPTEAYIVAVVTLALLPSAVGAALGAFTSRRIERSMPQLTAPL
ncbi:MAG TPA: hypothetical protein VFQ25_13185 [Ktedonobacterales bacterium]|nr:hypothetical protein [Ktedonobacterales bacterium]